MNKTANQRGKRFGILIGGIVFIIAFFGAQQLIKMFNPIDKQMITAAKDLTAQCPMMVDDYTRLDSVTSFLDKNFIYHYSLVHLGVNEVHIDTLKKYVEPEIFKSVRVSPEMKVFRDHKITLDYNYYDKNGLFITKFSATPEVYEKGN